MSLVTSTLNALILAAVILGLVALDWSFNDADVLIFVGRKLILTVEALAIWR